MTTWKMRTSFLFSLVCWNTVHLTQNCTLHHTSCDYLSLWGVTVTTLTKTSTSHLEIIVQKCLHTLLTRLKTLHNQSENSGRCCNECVVCQGTRGNLKWGFHWCNPKYTKIFPGKFSKFLGYFLKFLKIFFELIWFFPFLQNFTEVFSKLINYHFFEVFFKFFLNFVQKFSKINHCLWCPQNIV